MLAGSTASQTVNKHQPGASFKVVKCFWTRVSSAILVASAEPSAFWHHQFLIFIIQPPFY